MKKPEPSFEQFLEKFPELDLPIVLGEDTHHQFSKHNDPLSPPLIERYIQPFEQEQGDEFTEFIACFRVPKTYAFHAVVYWRAGLMNYTYTLITYTNRGELIDKKVIAGTFTDGEQLTHSIAEFDDDWTIKIVSGQALANDNQFDPTSSRVIKLELLPEGYIKEV